MLIGNLMLPFFIVVAFLSALILWRFSIFKGAYGLIFAFLVYSLFLIILWLIIRYSAFNLKFMIYADIFPAYAFVSFIIFAITWYWLYKKG